MDAEQELTKMRSGVKASSPRRITKTNGAAATGRSFLEPSQTTIQQRPRALKMPRRSQRRRGGIAMDDSDADESSDEVQDAKPRNAKQDFGLLRRRSGLLLRLCRSRRQSVQGTSVA